MTFTVSTDFLNYAISWQWFHAGNYLSTGLHQNTDFCFREHLLAMIVTCRNWDIDSTASPALSHWLRRVSRSGPCGPWRVRVCHYSANSITWIISDNKMWHTTSFWFRGIFNSRIGIRWPEHIIMACLKFTVTNFRCFNALHSTEGSFIQNSQFAGCRQKKTEFSVPMVTGNLCMFWGFTLPTRMNIRIARSAKLDVPFNRYCDVQWESTIFRLWVCWGCRKGVE